MTSSRRKSKELLCWGQCGESKSPMSKLEQDGIKGGPKGRDTGSLSKQDKKTYIFGSRSTDKASCPSGHMLSCCFHTGPSKTCLESKGWSTLPRRLVIQKWKFLGPCFFFFFSSSGKLTSNIYPDAKFLGSLFKMNFIN